MEISISSHIFRPGDDIDRIAFSYGRFVRPNICVLPSDFDSEFVQKIRDMIDRIELNPVGKRLLDRIEKKPFCRACIVHQLEIGEDAIRFFTVSNISAIEKLCIIGLCPDGEHSVLCDMKGRLIHDTQPYFVSLFHELVHGYHYFYDKIAEKKVDGSIDSFLWSCAEEYHTIVGFPSKKENRILSKITENAFRHYEGKPRRISHFQITDEIISNFLKKRCAFTLDAQRRALEELPKDSLAPPSVSVIKGRDLKPMVGILAYAITDSNFESIAFVNIADLGPESEEVLISRHYKGLEPGNSLMKEYFPDSEITSFKINNLFLFAIDREDYAIVMQDLMRNGSEPLNEEWDSEEGSWEIKMSIS